jgi:hypothetical protein
MRRRCWIAGGPSSPPPASTYLPPVLQLPGPSPRRLLPRQGGGPPLHAPGQPDNNAGFAGGEVCAGAGGGCGGAAGRSGLTIRFSSPLSEERQGELKKRWVPLLNSRILRLTRGVSVSGAHMSVRRLEHLFCRGQSSFLWYAGNNSWCNGKEIRSTDIGREHS